MVPQVRVAEDGSLIIDEERSVHIHRPGFYRFLSISVLLWTWKWLSHLLAWFCFFRVVSQFDSGSPASQRAKPGSGPRPHLWTWLNYNLLKFQERDLRKTVVHWRLMKRIFLAHAVFSFDALHYICFSVRFLSETDMFFLAVSMVGTDFSMICQLFPHRTRSEIKVSDKYRLACICRSQWWKIGFCCL